MIERWLQVTCDYCGETETSTSPDQTATEFLADISPPWRKVKRGHACSERCAEALASGKKGVLES